MQRRKVLEIPVFRQSWAVSPLLHTFFFHIPSFWSKLFLVSSVCFDGKSNIDIPFLRVTRSLHVASSRDFFDLVFLKQRKIFTISNLKYLPGLCGRGGPCIPPFYNIPGRSFGHPLGFCLFVFYSLSCIRYFLFVLFLRLIMGSLTFIKISWDFKHSWNVWFKNALWLCTDTKASYWLARTRAQADQTVRISLKAAFAIIYSNMDK